MKWFEFEEENPRLTKQLMRLYVYIYQSKHTSLTVSLNNRFLLRSIQIDLYLSLSAPKGIQQIQFSAKSISCIEIGRFPW